MQTIQDRLALFLAELNISVQKFERQCDMGQGGASKLTPKSYSTTFAKISKAFPQLNIEWLKTGNGNMYKNPESMKIDLDLNMDGNSQIINNIGDAQTQIAVLNERIKMLNLLLKSKESEIEGLSNLVTELKKNLETLNDVNKFLMNK